MPQELSDKRYLYKTAFSPLYNEYVGIKKVRQDRSGQFIFDCHIAYHNKKLTSFREHELRNFVL